MTDATIVIEVAPHPPELAGLAGIRIPAGSAIGDALAAIGIAAGSAARIGIWGREASKSAVLADGDRIEFYRALIADPKEQRRARLRRAGKKRD
ncbi:MAG TPA: RnfH family protein [Gammaproteobacteria bacterium]|nr:RnfH family protein [Gammaproteobacteria bacterium]